MSFLNFDIYALPKSCQSAIQRTGRCGCLACIGAVAPTPSSTSSSISKSIKALLSGSSSNTNSNNTSSTSVNQSGDSVLDASELHLLTILSGIDKLRLERDAVEAARLALRDPIGKAVRREKRKAPCSSDEDGVEIVGVDGLQILREIWEMVDVVMERRKLVPVSQVRRWTELRWEMGGKGKEGPVSAWGKVRGRLHLLSEGGKRKCWRAVGKLGGRR
jgi:hypothetical protein